MSQRTESMSFSKDAQSLMELSKQGSDYRENLAPDPAWRSRSEIDSAKGGFFISKPRKADDIPDALDLFKDFDLDPNQWSIVSVRRSRWQRYDGEFLESAKISIVPVGQSAESDTVDVEQLIAEMKKWRPSKGLKVSTGDLAAVFAIGDTQWGKDAGDGTEGTIARVFRGLDESLIRYRELIKIGRPIGTIVLPQLGDCIEGSTSQNGKVLTRSDQSLTTQVRIGRRMLLAWVKAFAPLTEKLIVPVVPGNHDESHRFGITDPVDSWQIEVAAAVEDICRENPELDHVEFRYPTRDNGTLAINIGGQILGMAHGHQFKDATKWLSMQATGRTPVGDSDILLTAHYHHFISQQVGHRLHIQIPAMDGGSPWFRDRAGLESPTGIVSFVIGQGHDPRRDLAVLAGEARV